MSRPTPKIIGYNVDRIRELKACGYSDSKTVMVIEHALMRWARGEEEQAQRGAIDRSFHGINLTCWVRVLAAGDGNVIAALFIDPRGPYANRADIDAWDEFRDARKYAGPWPVVAHPPCQRWGRYWSGGPSVKVRREKGDDGGCFESALASVRQWGGVLEHPEASHAFKAHGIPTPIRGGGWTCTSMRSKPDHAGDEYSCCVEQGHYGHPARKATWLFYVGQAMPRSLTWGPSRGVRLDEGFHSKAERAAARAAGQKPIKRLSTVQNIVTPPAFAEVLIELARMSRGMERAA